MILEENNLFFKYPCNFSISLLLRKACSQVAAGRTYRTDIFPIIQYWMLSSRLCLAIISQWSRFHGFFRVVGVLLVFLRIHFVLFQSAHRILFTYWKQHISSLGAGPCCSWLLWLHPYNWKNQVGWWHMPTARVDRIVVCWLHFADWSDALVSFGRIDAAHCKLNTYQEKANDVWEPHNYCIYSYQSIEKPQETGKSVNAQCGTV